MAFMHEFPHTHNFDSDLREILEMYLTLKDLPKTWETYKEMVDTDYAELKTFINGYFDNLDVQNEINNKIDSMVKDGTMANIIGPIFNEHNQKLGVLEARMNTFTSLEEGSTTGDAELMDAHIDYKGFDHKHLGVHIRTITKELSSDISDLSKFIIWKAKLNTVEHDIEVGDVFVITNNTIGNVTIKTKLDNTYESDAVQTLTDIPAGNTIRFVATSNANYFTSYMNFEGFVEIVKVTGGVLEDRENIDTLLKFKNDVTDALSGKHEITDEFVYNHGYYYYDNAILYVENETYRSTTIEYDGGEIWVTSNSNDLAQMCFYFSGEPKNSTYIGSEPFEYPSGHIMVSVVKHKLTIPSECKYIIINNRSTVGELHIYTENIKYIKKEINKYKNKSFLMLGDSITQLGVTDRGWVKYFNEVVEAKRIDNTSVVGCHWCDYNNNTIYDGNPTSDNLPQNVIGNQIQKIINNRNDFLDDYDYIFIACGTNDSDTDGILTLQAINNAYFNDGSIKPLDAVDRSTWAGATRYAVEKLNELFPNAKIIFNTPINRIDFYNATRVTNNAKIIRQCSEQCSVYLCDSQHCGITMFDTSYFVDNLHPSIKGAKKLGYYIANWFISNFN